MVSCQGCGISTTNRLCCPTCSTFGRTSFFCSQECFANNWTGHSKLHQIVKHSFHLTSSGKSYLKCPPAANAGGTLKSDASPAEVETHPLASSDHESFASTTLERRVQLGNSHEKRGEGTPMITLPVKVSTQYEKHSNYSLSNPFNRLMGQPGNKQVPSCGRQPNEESNSTEATAKSYSVAYRKCSPALSYVWKHCTIWSFTRRNHRCGNLSLLKVVLLSVVLLISLIFLARISRIWSALNSVGMSHYTPKTTRETGMSDMMNRLNTYEGGAGSLLAEEVKSLQKEMKHLRGAVQDYERVVANLLKGNDSQKQIEFNTIASNATVSLEKPVNASFPHDQGHQGFDILPNTNARVDDRSSANRATLMKLEQDKSGIPDAGRMAEAGRLVEQLEDVTKLLLGQSKRMHKKVSK